MVRFLTLPSSSGLNLGFFLSLLSLSFSHSYTSSSVACYTSYCYFYSFICLTKCYSGFNPFFFLFFINYLFWVQFALLYWVTGACISTRSIYCRIPFLPPSRPICLCWKPASVDAQTQWLALSYVYYLDL